MSERDNFEKEWKDVLEGAEKTPSKNVWSNIRAEVASSQVNEKSKQLVYWRWFTAAAVTLLIVAGIGGMYYHENMSQEYQQLAQLEQGLLKDIAQLEDELCDAEQFKLLAEQQLLVVDQHKDNTGDKGQANTSLTIDNTGQEKLSVSQLPMAQNDAIAYVEDKTVKEGTRALAVGTETIEKTQKASQSGSLTSASKQNPLDNDEGEKSQQILSVAFIELDQNEYEEVMNLDNQKTLAESKTARKSSQSIELLESLEVDQLANLPESIEPQKVPNYMEIIKMKNGDKNTFRGMWAGLSLGGGSYDPNTGQGSSSTLSFAAESISDGQTTINNAQQVNQSSVETPDFAFTIGADFGKQIGRRTFLQGGLEYNKYSSEATSNISIADANNLIQSFFEANNSASLEDVILMETSSYTVSNSFHYVSIPVKMGYQIIDRKIGLSLSSGVSTNLFLKNTLKDQSGDRADVEITNGEESPYKPINFNGLLSMELSYRWNDYYRLSLVPDYRISLDGIAKSDAFFQSNPTAFFLGFRFKYILK